MSFQSPSRAAAATGLEPATVRARLATNDQTAEIAAVPCQLNGPGYSARFVTPAVLDLPIFGSTAPQVSLSCTFEGETRTRALRATNVSELERRKARERALDELREEGRSGASVLLTIGLGQRGPRGFDEFDYPDTAFVFRR
ncbi:MAG: hypothetical protein AAGF78_07475 [Pseudomonadota bacterium]